MIQQIGARLVRSFGNGETLRTIVTETIGEGRTLTKVLDSEGKVITERLKQIVRDQNVGDKFVNTVTKVTKEGNDVTKNVKDTVYGTKDGVFSKLGQRIRLFFDGNKSASHKTITVGDKSLHSDISGSIRQFMHKSTPTSSDQIYCNYKGLPMPRELEGCGFGDSSMAEMRAAFQERFPHKSYAPEVFSFSAPANERVAGTTITDLEQYL